MPRPLLAVVDLDVQVFHGIDDVGTDMNLVMKMGTRGNAGVSYVADNLALLVITSYSIHYTKLYEIT